jgi:hypothetical protein
VLNLGRFEQKGPKTALASSKPWPVEPGSGIRARARTGVLARSICVAVCTKNRSDSDTMGQRQTHQWAVTIGYDKRGDWCPSWSVAIGMTAGSHRARQRGLFRQSAAGTLGQPGPRLAARRSERSGPTGQANRGLDLLEDVVASLHDCGAMQLVGVSCNRAITQRGGENPLTQPVCVACAMQSI